MIIVTGGAGFIGGNVARSLAAASIDVVVVDDADPSRTGLLADVAIFDHRPQDALLEVLGGDRPPAGLEAVVHQGACADTTVTDEAFLQATNVDYTIALVDACQRWGVPLVYASSAAVYGAGPRFDEAAGNERPRNAYARSKAQVDVVVRQRLADLRAPVVGLRYFNVYGPGERHKGAMASMVVQLVDQVRSSGEARLFGAGEGAEAGKHQRDFVHVDDVVQLVRWFLDRPSVSGIFNCGTGQARTFLDLAGLVVGTLGTGTITTVPFPAHLRGRYQSHTCADLRALRAAGYDRPFEPIDRGVPRYVAELVSS